MENFPEIDLFPRLTRVTNFIKGLFDKYPTGLLSPVSDHKFDRENPDMIPFEEESVQPSFWDSSGFPHYSDEVHHTQDGFVANRSEAELGWDDMGTYYRGDQDATT